MLVFVILVLLFLIAALVVLFLIAAWQISAWFGGHLHRDEEDEQDTIVFLVDKCNSLEAREPVLHMALFRQRVVELDEHRGASRIREARRN